MRIQRLLGLLWVLAETDRITVRELADRFEVSRRTILRDLDTLNCAGIPIVSQPGAGGGVSVVEGYRIHKKILSEGDTEKLLTALNGLKSIDGDNGVNSLLAKLVPEDEGAVFSKSQYVISLSSWFADSIIQEKAAALHRAICQRRMVVMEYVSGSGRCRRTVEPHKLIFKQSDWYLYGFCHEREDFRLFKLRRIVSWELAAETFAPREIRRISFPQGYGADRFSPCPREGFFQVVLEYDLRDEFALTQKIDASFFRETDDEAHTGRICFYTPELSFAGDLVFGLLDKVRVIAPQPLIAHVRRRLENVNRFYEGDCR